MFDASSSAALCPDEKNVSRFDAFSPTILALDDEGAVVVDVDCLAEQWQAVASAVTRLPRVTRRLRHCSNGSRLPASAASYSGSSGCRPPPAPLPAGTQRRSPP